MFLRNSMEELGRWLLSEDLCRLPEGPWRLYCLYLYVQGIWCSLVFWRHHSCKWCRGIHTSKTCMHMIEKERAKKKELEAECIYFHYLIIEKYTIFSVLFTNFQTACTILMALKKYFLILPKYFSTHLLLKYFRLELATKLCLLICHHTIDKLRFYSA